MQKKKKLLTKFGIIVMTSNLIFTPLISVSANEIGETKEIPNTEIMESELSPVLDEEISEPEVIELPEPEIIELPEPEENIEITAAELERLKPLLLKEGCSLRLVSRGDEKYLD